MVHGLSLRVGNTWKYSAASSMQIEGPSAAGHRSDTGETVKLRVTRRTVLIGSGFGFQSTANGHESGVRGARVFSLKNRRSRDKRTTENNDRLPLTLGAPGAH